MRLTDFLDPDLVFVNLTASDRKDLFEQMLAKICASHDCLDKDVCLDLLLERERQYGTGLEHGTAVPHAVVPGLTQTLVAVGTLTAALEFGAEDERPVRIVFMLLSPPDAMTRHIRILARIARFCAIPSFLENILKAQDAKQLFQVIVGEDQRHV